MHSDVVSRQLVAAKRIIETCAIHVIAGVDATSD